MSPLSFIEGDYQSPPRRISPVARAFPSLVFYQRFFSTVRRAGAAAKRSRYGDAEWTQSSLEVMRHLEAVGVDFEITGIDNLQRAQAPFVVVGNHMSTLETAVLPVLIQPFHKVTFVVKASLLEYPVFKYVMRSRDPIALTQTNPREDLKRVLEQGAARLQKGTSLVVFPQGRRRPSFDPSEFNTLGVKLAQREGVPIVPVALLTDAWAIGKRVADLGRIDPRRKVRFAFGEPMVVSGRGADEHRAVIDFIQSKLYAWQAEDSRAQHVIEPGIRPGASPHP